MGGVREVSAAIVGQFARDDPGIAADKLPRVTDAEEHVTIVRGRDLCDTVLVAANADLATDALYSEAATQRGQAAPRLNENRQPRRLAADRKAPQISAVSFASLYGAGASPLIRQGALRPCLPQVARTDACKIDLYISRTQRANCTR